MSHDISIRLGPIIPFLTVDRVKYFRDRSALHRAREEKEILECEMVRTKRSFVVMKESWSEHGKREKEKSAVASAAYASKQAEMYARLARDAQVVQEKAEKKRVVYQQWYTNFIYTPLFELIRLFSFMQDGISTLNQSVDIML